MRFSRLMAYLPKTKGVEAAWLRDAIHQAAIELLKIVTDKNGADPMTKALRANLLARHMRNTYGVVLVAVRP